MDCYDACKTQECKTCPTVLEANANADRKNIAYEVQRLIDLRREKKVTMRDLSSRVNLSVTILSRIERGEELPPKVILDEIESALLA